MKNPTMRLKAQIHIAKQQLGMDDDTYRTVLKTTVGKDSCNDMSFKQLHQVVEAMKQRGFKVQRKGKKLSPQSTGTRVDKMRAIWISMGKKGFIADASETALLNWVKNSLSKAGQPAIDSLSWLNSHDACNRLLEQLKRWHDRCHNDAFNTDMRLISQALDIAERRGQLLSQSEITQMLLDHSVITWHELFVKIGLTNQPSYTVDRTELRPLFVIYQEAACN